MYGNYHHSHSHLRPKVMIPIIYINEKERGSSGLFLSRGVRCGFVLNLSSARIDVV